MSTRQRAKRADHRYGHLLAGGGGGAGRAGELAFKVGGRDIGHLHGDHSAHFGFPKEVWAPSSSRDASTITRSSRAGRGFGVPRIDNQADVEGVIALMRLNYERVVARHGLPTQAAA